MPLSLDFNFTAKTARRTSRQPFLTELRPVQNSTDFRLDTTEHIHENLGQGDDAGLVILSFVVAPCVYLIGREPVMRMSTSLLALCCHSGPEATWETPISARSRSNGSRSLRISRVLMARFTNESIAPWI